MFLICCPNKYALQITKGLDEIDIKSFVLPTMDYIYDKNALSQVSKSINEFDIVIIPSGIIIDYAKDVIKSAVKPVFMTVGKQSAKKLESITKQQIIYPETNSGGFALFEEKIESYDNLYNKKILVLKGEGGSKELYCAMHDFGLKFTMIDLYKRHLNKLPANYLKKILMTEGLQGIILTTSILVDWLFTEAKQANCVELLKNILFITIHPRIEQKLKNYGVNTVQVTAHVDRMDVVGLIRGLYV